MWKFQIHSSLVEDVPIRVIHAGGDHVREVANLGAYDERAVGLRVRVFLWHVAVPVSGALDPELGPSVDAESC